MDTIGGMFPIKFIYTQRPVITISIPWEQRAFDVAAQVAYEQAKAQQIVLACAWHPPTDVHHTWHRHSPLLMRRMPNYSDFQEPIRLGIAL